jgi:hypothetical protein
MAWHVSFENIVLMQMKGDGWEGVVGIEMEMETYFEPPRAESAAGAGLGMADERPEKARLATIKAERDGVRCMIDFSLLQRFVRLSCLID